MYAFHDKINSKDLHNDLQRHVKLVSECFASRWFKINAFAIFTIISFARKGSKVIFYAYNLYHGMEWCIMCELYNA